MKSMQQSTGLSAKETKLKNVLYNLFTYWMDHNTKNTEELSKKGKLDVKINRYELNQKLAQGINPDYPVERHTIYKMVNFLLAKGFLVQNPTSHIQGGRIAPSLNTKYFIDGRYVEEEWHKLCEKRDAYTLKVLQKKSATTHTLDQFSNDNCAKSSSTNRKSEDKLTEEMN